jgi:exonuclease III
MSCLSWNSRGLGNAATVKELRELTKKFALSVLCVLETQVHKTRVESLKGTLGFDNYFAVSSDGRSGGLGIFWNNEIKLQLLPYSQYHVDAIITEGSNDPWRVTCVRGSSDERATQDMGYAEIHKVLLRFTLGLHR